MHIYMHIYTHTYTYTYIYRHTYTYIYKYIPAPGGSSPSCHVCIRQHSSVYVSTSAYVRQHTSAYAGTGGLISVVPLLVQVAFLGYWAQLAT